jgi:hypothetical protein
VLTWQNRISRIREHCRDLFGREGWRWRVIRTSNAYTFHDPPAVNSRLVSSKSDQRTGTPDQEISTPSLTPAVDPASMLGRALARLGTVLAAKEGIEQGAGG